jgi:hypothetical protein
MGFVSVSEITKTAKNIVSKKRGSNADVLIGTHRSSGGRFSLAVSISEGIAAEARIADGDRVDVLFDRENNRGLLRRVITGGWKIGVAGPRLAVKISYVEGMPSFRDTAMAEAEVIVGGIEFQLPEGASFTENLRALAIAEAEAVQSEIESAAE